MGPKERATLPQTAEQSASFQRERQNRTSMSADKPENARLAQPALSVCITAQGSARKGRQDMNRTHTITITGTRIGWAEASPDSDLPPGIIVTTTNRQLNDQPERFPNSLLGQDAQGALIYQIDAGERQLREAVELVPAGAAAEFRVRIQDQGRLRLEGIAPTAPS